MRKILIILYILGTGLNLQAQDDLHISDSSYSLLKNPYVQIEATQAINDMYNFKFEQSMKHFNYLKKQYGWHPLPYFMMGLNYWWRIVPDFKNEEWDTEFYAYMDTALIYSERLYKKYNPIEGAFFLAAAYAFKAKLQSERGEYGAAAYNGRHALKYLEECKANEDFSPELLFGDGLFNYYAEWIPENYPMLKPLMLMFPDGDKKLGIEQLKEVARNAFYTRTEAQYYLMRIAYFEENDLQTSLQVAEYLHETFPGNAYFHRFYARLLYQTGRYTQAIEESESILDRIDSARAGYEYNSGRYASFFLGHIHELRHDYEKSKKYFKLAMEYAEASDATEMGYYIFSILHLGRIALREENFEEAEKYFTKVKKVTKRNHSANKEARERLKEL